MKGYTSPSTCCLLPRACWHGGRASFRLLTVAFRVRKQKWTSRMRLRDHLAGPAIVTAFLVLFVYLMNEISAPNAPLSLANYLILVDLVVGFALVRSVWSIVV